MTHNTQHTTAAAAVNQQCESTTIENICSITTNVEIYFFTNNFE